MLSCFPYIYSHSSLLFISNILCNLLWYLLLNHCIRERYLFQLFSYKIVQKTTLYWLTVCSQTQTGNDDMVTDCNQMQLADCHHLQIMSQGLVSIKGKIFNMKFLTKFVIEIMLFLMPYRYLKEVTVIPLWLLQRLLF